MRNYEVVLQPSRGWFRVDWKAIIESRDLLMILVWRDFTIKHRQTLLGPAWLILNPLMTTAIFTVVFRGIARISTDGAPPILFYLCGLLGWNFFSTTLQQTSSTLVHNVAILQKVYFPRLVLPLAAAASGVMAFLIQLALFALLWLYFKLGTEARSSLHIGAEALMLPILLLHAGAIALGVGLWFASLTVRYRDLLQVVGVVVQLWMYATPVIYPISEAPPRYQWIIALNPVAPVIESFRVVLLGRGTFEPFYYGVSVALTILLLFSGVMLFQRTERTFIDTI